MGEEHSRLMEPHVKTVRKEYAWPLGGTARSSVCVIAGEQGRGREKERKTERESTSEKAQAH